MTEFAHAIDVGLVTAPGRDRHQEIRSAFGLDSGVKLAYFYVGRYGQDSLRWDTLAALASRGVHFVGFHEAPVGPLPNLHVVDPRDWTGADLMASCDIAIAKAGYGTVCDAMVAGTPLVYPHRAGFAEHAVLDQALRLWGGGVGTTADRFAALDLTPEIDRALRLRPGSPPFFSGGASRVAEHLLAVCRGTSTTVPLGDQP
jgi:hypothetical protein